MGKRRFSAEETDGILRKAREMDRSAARLPAPPPSQYPGSRAALLSLLGGGEGLKRWGLWFVVVTWGDQETRQEYQRQWQAAFPQEDFLAFCKACYVGSGPCQSILDAKFRRLLRGRGSPPV